MFIAAVGIGYVSGGDSTVTGYMAVGVVDDSGVGTVGVGDLSVWLRVSLMSLVSMCAVVVV